MSQCIPVHAVFVYSCSKGRWHLKGSEDDAVFGLTDIGGENFGKFGSEKDPHRDIQPVWLDPRAPWKQQPDVDFLPELREIQQRIQVQLPSSPPRWVEGERGADLTVCSFLACLSVCQGVNLYLVGMPGTGKTTVGRMLAEGLNYRWLDLDAFIETVRGCTKGEGRSWGLSLSFGVTETGQDGHAVLRAGRRGDVEEEGDQHAARGEPAASLPRRLVVGGRRFLTGCCLLSLVMALASGAAAPDLRADRGEHWRRHHDGEGEPALPAHRPHRLARPAGTFTGHHSQGTGRRNQSGWLLAGRLTHTHV